MSGLWAPGDDPGAVPGPGPGPAEPVPSPEEVEALRELHDRLRATPVADLIANHALGLWQVALVHLGVASPPDATGAQPPADLASAGLAIDALAALVDGLGPRLDEYEDALRDALTQVQMLFIEIADRDA
ncbi:MAG: DUF1844 domain-containing protein [Actinomycetota bacterium]|nr:DUF1844 domain-containing protein [Actinomycetota bacterium]